ncbi:class II myosin [Didymella pomorum]
MTGEAVEDVGGPVATFTHAREQDKRKDSVVTIGKEQPSNTSRALVIAGAGMRRKHSYDTGVGRLDDIEEVDSVFEKDSVLNQAFLEEGAEENYMEESEVEDDNETLVEVDGELYKEKEVEIEVSDSEPPSDTESEAGQQDGCGVKRKRTIRVVIRSRAFI